MRAIRFRRFCRASWAAYSSMHREVTIGRLAARVADCSLAKAGAALVLGLVLTQGTLAAQTDDGRETRTLPEVQVVLTSDSLQGSAEPVAVLSAEQIQSSNIHSIGDLVALLPGVDLRVRGGDDVQGDLSMRGSSFDQMLVLLNGINLTDAQTGHHTMDIPVDLTMVQRVELLGPAQLLARGIVAYCGAVNIVVCDDYRDRLLAQVAAGSHGSAHASLLATRAAGPWALTLAGTYSRSDGYRPNTDYRHGSLLMQARRHGERHDLHLLAGVQAKAFGSAGFYSTAFPDQYEATRTLVVSATDSRRCNGFSLQTSLYGRLHADRFELFRDGYVSQVPDWYAGHNRHLSSLLGLRSEATVPLGPGSLLAGVDLRREGIWSNVLGQPDSSLAAPYDHSDARLGASLFGGYRYAGRRLQALAVALGHLNSRFGPHCGLAAAAEYRLPWLGLQLALSHTYRLPSFTDLYYQSANQRANPDLGPEHSTAVELTAASRGLEHADLQLTAYYRAGRQTIDWVRRPDEELWYSMNHTAVDACGLEALGQLRCGRLTLRAVYAFCHVAADAGEWVSGSSQDYLRHQARCTARLALGERLWLRAGAAVRHRQGSWADADGRWQPYGTVALLDAGAEYALPCGFTLSADVHNLLDRQWRDHGGTPQPGRTLWVGLRWAGRQ